MSTSPWYAVRGKLAKRYFSPVRQLDWCDQGLGLSRKRINNEDDLKNKPAEADFVKRTLLFGIICTMSSNRVIGKLPWQIPQNYEYFKKITKNKIVILGRLSFENIEWMHASKSIVISSTLDKKSVDASRTKVARSFDEALQEAMIIAEDDSIQYKSIDYRSSCNVCISMEDQDRYESDIDDNIIDIWVLGGERIFEEALRHPGAEELRITKVDTEIDTSSCKSRFVRFPPPYRWDRKFKQVQKWDGFGLPNFKYAFHVYKRVR